MGSVGCVVGDGGRERRETGCRGERSGEGGREGRREREREREGGREREERERERGREGEMHDSLDHKKWQMLCLHFSMLDPDGYFHLECVLLVCLYQLE